MKNVPNNSILVSWELEEKVQWSLIKLYNKQLNLWFNFGFCYSYYHKHCSWQGAIEICKVEMTKLETVWVSQKACLSETDFAKSNPEGRLGQFLFNSDFSSELAMGSVFDPSLLQTEIKGILDLQILIRQVLVCKMKTSTGSGLGEAVWEIVGAALYHQRAGWCHPGDGSSKPRRCSSHPRCAVDLSACSAAGKSHCDLSDFVACWKGKKDHDWMTSVINSRRTGTGRVSLHWKLYLGDKLQSNFSR